MNLVIPMEITINQSNHLKSIAILMMLCLHLFNTLDYEGLFTPIIFIGSKPLIYYISLFCDACVPIFAFVSGYGLYGKYGRDSSYGIRSNFKRLYSLYKNYWMVMIIFVFGMGFLLQKDGYPGGLLKFLMALSGITAWQYNGAAWFFTIYVAFVVSSKAIFLTLDRFPKKNFFAAMSLYFIGFYFRIYKPQIFDDVVLQWCHENISLFAMTLFQFLLGAYSLKYKCISRFSCAFNSLPFKNLISILGMVVLVIFHAYVSSFIVAPITALGFIFLFVQIDKPKLIERGLDFLTPHATNIWLTHMFFYLIYFKDFIYRPGYVVPIFFLLLTCCIASSYVINYVLNLKIKMRPR